MKTAPGLSASRRRVLIAGAVSALALGATGTLSVSRYARGRAAWIERAVRSNLPGVQLDEPSLAQFVQEVLAGQPLASHKKKVVLATQQNLPWLAARVPRLRRSLARLERQVLTQYLLGSNFFQVADPRRTTISYYGSPPGCGNPFAVLA